MKKKSTVLLVGIYDTNTVSLAPNILKGYAMQFPIANEYDIETVEFSIFNDSAGIIVDFINNRQPDVVGFSAYIWNINEILEIATSINTNVIIGGSQVTGIEREILSENSCVDIIVTGEGEQTFVELLEHFSGTRELESIDGITTQNIQTKPRVALSDLNSIPSVYNTIFSENPELSSISFETSRGCPMNCQYCTWGYSKKMRYYNLDRVFHDLDIILGQPSVKEIYLCDSSLLLNKERAKKVFGYLISRNVEKKIRFEFSAEQLDDEIIDQLAHLTHGEFNFGLQTINEQALNAASRPFNKQVFEKNYEKIVNRIHNANITIDLIYGLPGDNIEGFKNSIEYALSLKNVRRILTNPLILLPGSGFFKHRGKYGLKLQDNKTYLVKSSNSFLADEMELARKYSFYVNIIYLNSALTECMKESAKKNGKRFIDFIIEFMDSLPFKLFQADAPNMIPSMIDGFKHRNQSLKYAIDRYEKIIQHFIKFADWEITAKLINYHDYFSEHYYKIKKWIA